MRIRSLAPLVFVALFAGAALAQDEYPDLVSGRQDPGPTVEVKGSLWLTEGSTEVVSRSLSGEFDHDSNLMAVLEAEAALPDLPWISVDGRIGTTLRDSGGEFDDGDEDSDASFGLFELNLAVSLAGRGSPLAPNHALPRTHAEAFVGLKAFTEEFDAERNNADVSYETLWMGPQLGLRGYWHLSDTYADDYLKGWGLSAGAAVMPWLTVQADSEIDGGAEGDQDSSSGYGYSWFAGASYRTGPAVFGLGYELQSFKTDDGDEDLSGGGSGHLYSLESKRHGFFLSAGVRF